MVWITLLGIVCLWLVGGMLLEDLGDADRWTRRTVRRKLRDRASADRSAF